MPLGDELLNTVAGLLGKLRWKVVYLGGSTTHLHLSDPTAPAPELTDDVDVVLDVTSPVEFQVSVREELRAPHLLPGGTSIYLIRAPVFLATKLEAYRDRGEHPTRSSDVFERVQAILTACQNGSNSSYK